MKRLFYFILVMGFLASCTIKTGEDQAQTEDTETPSNQYGEPINTEGAIQASNLQAELGELDSAYFKVAGTITKTCARKGCWMTIDTGNGETMRVTFKDYGFFVPKEGVEGSTAVFEGLAKRKVTSVDMLQHFAEDEGKSEEEIANITEPKEELVFIANGVVIEDEATN